MSDYTPDGWTKEAWHKQMFTEVAVAYRLVEMGLVNTDEPFDDEFAKEVDARYKEWLTEVKVQERKAERERIIKELEVCEDGHSMPEGDGRWAIVLRTAISIVRGEGK